MAARADRSRGLLRRPKAMASASPNVVGWSSGLSAAGGPRDAWPGAAGLTTVSAELTSRPGGSRTRAATPAGETSGGVGKGAQPATTSRGTRTWAPLNRLGTVAGRGCGHGPAIRAIRSPSLGQTTGGWHNAPTVQGVWYFLPDRH